jgi:hypothetical protein
MKQRGRKPKADGEVVALNVIEGDFGRGLRPDPPADMTPRQSEIWRETVADEPLEHFSTAATRAMLRDYCQLRESLEKLHRTINDFEEAWLKSKEGVKRYLQLCKNRDLETRGASSLATRLRLTNQSRYTPRAAQSASANTLKGNKPWDWDPPPDGT